jgi:hypothetical protein
MRRATAAHGRLLVGIGQAQRDGARRAVEGDVAGRQRR